MLNSARFLLAVMLLTAPAALACDVVKYDSGVQSTPDGKYTVYVEGKNSHGEVITYEQVSKHNKTKKGKKAAKKAAKEAEEDANESISKDTEACWEPGPGGY